MLVVEDDEIILRAAARILEKIGHTARTAVNGQEALERLTAQGVDLVLMDVQMPVMDGVEATRRIRDGAAGEGQGVPILAMTAYAMTGDRGKFLAAGMDGYLSKPLGREELVAQQSNKLFLWIIRTKSKLLMA